MGVFVRPINNDTFFKSQFYRNKYGLLVNDSAIAASIEQEGILNLASNDNSFLIVDEIKVYQPTDLTMK